MILKPHTSCLIISNVQEELVTILHQGQKLIDDCCWLIEIAKKLDIPIIMLEHKGLGPTVSSIKKLTNGIPYVEMVQFSCMKDNKCMQAIDTVNRSQIVFAGTEAHITIMQSTADLIKTGKEIFVLANAVSSRSNEDINFAIPRLRQIGAQVVSKEMVFFEWVEYSENPKYLDLSRKYLDGRYIRM